LKITKIVLFTDLLYDILGFDNSLKIILQHTCVAALRLRNTALQGCDLKDRACDAGEKVIILKGFFCLNNVLFRELSSDVINNLRKIFDFRYFLQPVIDFQLSPQLKRTLILKS
jgi:hypothetical protein